VAIRRIATLRAPVWRRYRCDPTSFSDGGGLREPRRYDGQRPPRSMITDGIPGRLGDGEGRRLTMRVGSA
jgi:hypothetical protein